MLGLIAYIIIALCVALGGLILKAGWGGPEESRGGHWIRIPPQNQLLLVVGWAIIYPSLAFALALSVLWPCNYFSSLNAVQELRAFRNTQATYIAAIQAAEKVHIAGAEAGLVDLAHQEQSQAYTDLVRQYRDKIDWYNNNLQQTKALNENPVIGWMRVGIGDLEPITGGLEVQ